VIKRVLENFYLRNLAVLLVLASVHIGSRSTGPAFGYTDVIASFLFAGWSCLVYIIHNRVLYDKLWKRKHYLLYVISFLLLLWAYRQVHNMLTAEFEKIWIRLTTSGWLALYWLDTIYFYLALGVYLAFTWSKDRERLLQTDNEKKALELKQLNEQLNPHFLFNALNNIYSYLLSGQPGGKELVLKLSELMRYILDSSKKDKVPAHDEIVFIRHYIAFQQERLGDRCQVDFVATEHSSRPEVVPLLLFNFIENAFKHGTASIRRSTVTVHITVSDHSLQLYVANPLTDAGKVTTGTGLANTRRRLELLYPGRYELETGQASGQYTVSLTITGL